MLADKLHLFKSQFFIAALRGGNRVRVFKVFKTETANSKCVRTDTGDFFIYISVKSL